MSVNEGTGGTGDGAEEFIVTGTVSSAIVGGTLTKKGDGGLRLVGNPRWVEVAQSAVQLVRRCPGVLGRNTLVKQNGQQERERIGTNGCLLAGPDCCLID